MAFQSGLGMARLTQRSSSRAFSRLMLLDLPAKSCSFFRRKSDSRTKLTVYGDLDAGAQLPLSRTARESESSKVVTWSQRSGGVVPGPVFSQRTVENGESEMPVTPASKATTELAGDGAPASATAASAEGID